METYDVRGEQGAVRCPEGPIGTDFRDVISQNSRSKQLLNKAYDYLDSIDLSKLSWSEMKDFLEVVQKGQFLESFGQVPSYGFGGCFNGPIGTPFTAEANGDTDKAE